MRIYSEALQHELEVDPDTVVDEETGGSSVITGIRANEVIILREDASPSRWENTLQGRVHAIMDKGASYTVLFKPDDVCDLTIEVELNSHAYRRLYIRDDKQIRVSLKKGNLFVIVNRP